MCWESVEEEFSDIDPESGRGSPVPLATGSIEKNGQEQERDHLGGVLAGVRPDT